MLALFNSGKAVEKRLITGDDIIAIIAETDVAIRIWNSIIEGGLDFTTLPTTPKEKVKLSQMWSDEQKKGGQVQPSQKDIPVVANKIEIISTEIRPKQSSDENSPPEAVNAKGVFFSGAATFYGATFSGKADFSMATFSSSARFSNATFSAETLFTSATFSAEASFWNATFKQLAYFKETRFLQRLSLSGTTIESYADFRDSEIMQLDFDNRLSPSIIKGRCDFRNATISDAHFQDVVFTQDVDFSDATFGKSIFEPSEGSDIAGPPPPSPYMGTSVLRFVTFESNAYFLRTKFLGRTSLERVNFQKEVDFTDADFKNPYKANVFSLSSLRFSNLRLSLDQLPDPDSWVKEDAARIKSFVDFVKEKDEQARLIAYQALQSVSKVLKSLEQHFRRQEQLEDANNAYYHFKLVEFQEAQAKGEWSWRLWIQKIFWGWPFAYGTGFWRAMAWTFGLNLLFALIYSTAGTLQREEESFATRDFVLKVRLLDYYKYYLPKDENHAVQLVDADSAPAPRSPVRRSVFWTFRNALWLSTALLFKVGFRDTTVSGRLLGIDLGYVVLFEWLFGFAVFAGLTVTLAKTQPLLNNLVKGLF